MTIFYQTKLPLVLSSMIRSLKVEIRTNTDDSIIPPAIGVTPVEALPNATMSSTRQDDPGQHVLYVDQRAIDYLDRRATAVWVVMACARFILGVDSELQHATATSDHALTKILYTKILGYACSVFGRLELCTAFDMYDIYNAKALQESLSTTLANEKDGMAYCRQVMDLHQKHVKALDMDTDAEANPCNIEQVLDLVNELLLNYETVKESE